MRVLVAESNGERLAWLQRCIGELGYTVAVAAEGHEALRAWEDGAHPLVVMEADLPGLGGTELCRRMQRRSVGDESPYVVLLVSKQTHDDLRQALAAGADDVVVRPIDEDELTLRLLLAERRIAERARVREEHRSYMDLLAQAPDLIQTVALDGQLLYANRAWCDALGYAERDIGQLSFFDLVQPTLRPAVRKAFRWVRGGRGIRHMQTELVTSDGRTLSVEGSLTPRFRGTTPTSVRVILNDISRRKRAETVLRNVLEGTSATTGADFYRSLVRHLSRALEVRHALVAERILGGGGRLRTLAAWSGDGFRRGQEIRVDDIEGPTLPGSRLLAQLGAESYLGVPVLGSDGKAIGLLCVLDEGPMRSGPDALRILATFAQRAGAELERERAEEARRDLDRRMQESQKLESMGVLAGGIAHDFNNLLTSIMGYASLAERSTTPGSAPHRYLVDIGTASRRAADLATQMLAYSGKGQFVIQPLDLRTVIREITELLGTEIRSRAVSLECDLPATPCAVEGDVTQIRQVVMNLVLNAAQATAGDGSTIVVRVGEQHLDEDDLARCYVGGDGEPGRYVALHVRDTGCGMDAATIERVFEPFFTTKDGGRGLGLAAVVGIVRGHRGALAVRSRPGAGTTMSVFLPPTSQPVPAVEQPEPRAPLAGEGLILVVDDEPSVRALTSQILAAGGYRVVTAADGQEGVAAFAARADEIDGVLLDLTMPVMGGVEALRRMRAERADVRVVVSSGYTKADALHRFRGEVPSAFIQKPYTAGELLQCMGDVVAVRVLPA